VTWFRDYLLHAIKSQPTQKEKVPHLAHLGHLRYCYLHLLRTQEHSRWGELDAAVEG
jgi:hypothetical protein